ncbi:uncharacterized protein LOC143681249 isoform X2 [Tamandua tetradactyla]|uniref:uncharacterized protein LOC143681249 isoform X2 n=1 Tax=Tamandua tetradactyla TaxID=48850 RepID=UPI00405499CC
MRKLTKEPLYFLDFKNICQQLKEQCIKHGFILKLLHQDASSWSLCSHIHHLFQGVFSQVQLKKLVPGLVQPLQTLSLSCTLSVFSLTNYAVNWIHQTLGTWLEWVGTMDYNNQTVQSQLSITKDTSKNKVYLKMNSLRVNDIAMNSCVKDTERRSQGELRHKCSLRVQLATGLQGVHRITRGCSGAISKSRCKEKLRKSFLAMLGVPCCFTTCNPITCKHCYIKSVLVC